MRLSLNQTDANDQASEILDAIPDPVFVMDRETRILASNSAAGQLPSDVGTVHLGWRGGEALHCVNSITARAGCGTSPACLGCLIRNSVREVADGGRMKDRIHRMQRVLAGKKLRVTLLVSAAPINWWGEPT